MISTVIWCKSKSELTIDTNNYYYSKTGKIPLLHLLLEKTIEMLVIDQYRYQT